MIEFHDVGVSYPVSDDDATPMTVFSGADFNSLRVRNASPLNPDESDLLINSPGVD